MVKDGKEVALRFYIPLDCALNVSKTVFYFYKFYEDKTQKEDK